MALSEASANEFDRTRAEFKDVIGEIKDDAKETRLDVGALRGGFSDLKETIIGWKGEVEARLVGYALRLEALEKSQGEMKAHQDKSLAGRTERVNVVLNAVLVALVLFVLYKVTGIKAP